MQDIQVLVKDYQRYDGGDAQLQAWDAADVYLREQASESLALADTVWVVGDHFGAITGMLPRVPTLIYSDSYIAREAIAKNVGIDRLESIFEFDALNFREYPVPQVVVGRVPKSKLQFGYLLAALRSVLPEGCKLFFSGMDKHLSKGQFDMLVKYFGAADYSRAKRKARVWSAVCGQATDGQLYDFGDAMSYEYIGLCFASLPAVFSASRLDVGTRFMLDNLSKIPSRSRVADLACGNGVIGITYAQNNTIDSICFTDESFQAVESTRRNIAGNADRVPSLQAQSSVIQQDGLDEVQTNSYDLILCNPPFHLQNSVSKSMAVKLFSDAHRCLSQGGEFWVVANRHLGYHLSLKELFSNCKVQASNSRFVLLKAYKR